MTTPSSTLSALAAAHGVATEFWDWQGRHTVVSAETIVTVLRAMDVEAGDEGATAAALEAATLREWRYVVPPTVVSFTGESRWVSVHVPDGAAVTLAAALEDGSTRELAQMDHYVPPQDVDGRRYGRATFEVPADLPAGWHELVATVEGAEPVRGVLVVAPAHLDLPEPVRGRRAWGLMTQLYQVRSHESWGVGDLHDLAAMAQWGADLGADFVLVNPVHAAEPSGHLEPSPYLPTTRRFGNPIYIHVEDAPGLADLTAAERERVEAYAASARRLDEHDSIDRDAAWAAKRSALEILHAAARRSGAEPEELTAYRLEHGPALEDFATWCAIADTHGADTTQWPDELRDPSNPAVAAFRAEHRGLVHLHIWLQWVFDTQMGRAQEAATAAGMRLGVFNDLAVGVHPCGADSWGLADVLASGVTVGAPPDQFNQLGQNWHQPPWLPGRLAEVGYAPFRDMVRAVLADSGGIRVDHIIGLFRLWWVPDGQSAAEGTYVRYDHEALIGILALEAMRAGALVVGEDLGVVEPTARDYLLRRGLLGTSILWFEWAGEGRPLPASDYRELCLASVTTHDLPPTAGYLGLVHVDLRERLGLLTGSAQEERAVEQASIDAVRRMLVEEGVLAPDADEQAVVVALHAHLVRSPARLLGVSVCDLVGDRRIINQPGTTDEYPNWRVPLAGPDGRPVFLEDVVRSPLAEAIAAVMPAGGARA